MALPHPANSDHCKESIKTMSKCPCRNDDCMLCDAVLLSGSSMVPACQMQGLVHKKTFAPKTSLFREGSPASHLYLLKSGCVKLTTALPDGRNQGLRLGSAWQFIGLEAINSNSYPYSAETITETDVCMVKNQDVLRLLEQNPQLALRLIIALNHELQSSNAAIRNLGMMNSSERVAAFLLNILDGRVSNGTEINLPLSRTDMAEMLGLTLETVSRVLSRMNREKIIRLQPGGRLLRIVDARRLKDLGGQSTVQDDWPQRMRA